MYLPVNFDIDPLPHLRPPQVPTTVLNHPPLVRMENHSLTPLGEKQANYQVPGNLITKPGKYRLAFRMRSRAEPIYFMRFVGSTKEMEQSMNERIMNFHAFAAEIGSEGLEHQKAEGFALGIRKGSSIKPALSLAGESHYVERSYDF